MYFLCWALGMLNEFNINDLLFALIKDRAAIKSCFKTWKQIRSVLVISMKRSLTSEIPCCKELMLK